MKLTTKLIICFGLCFIFGAQAFASEIAYAYVTVTNKNCKNAFYVREDHDPNPKIHLPYELYHAVPSGKTQSFQIPLWSSKGNDVSVAAYPHDNAFSIFSGSTYLMPNGSFTLTFYQDPFGICVTKPY